METEIESHPTANRLFAVLDCKQREQDALDRYGEFFEDPAHVAKIEAVKSIVDRFFRIKKGLYVNHRPNRGHPMTVIKVDDPVFPNTIRQADRQTMYYKPLKDLGVEIVYSKGTNSWLYRIR